MKESEHSIWMSVPQPLEAVQKIVTWDSSRLLLVRRTGIVQLMGRKEADLLDAGRMEGLDEEDCLESWSRDGRVFTLWSNLQIWSISLVDEKLSFVREMTLEIPSPLTAWHVAYPFLAVAFNNQPPLVYSLETFEPVFTASRPRPNSLGRPVKTNIISILCLPEENLLVCGLASGQVWTYCTLKEDRKDSGHATLQRDLYKAPIVGLHLAPGRSLIVSTQRGTCESYDLDSLVRTGGFKGSTGAIPLLLSQTTLRGDLIVTGSAERTVTVYVLATRKQVHRVYLGHVPKALHVLKVAKEGVKTGSDEVWKQLRVVKD